MRHRPLLIGLLAMLAAVPLGAQSIKGTVVDETTKIPIASVLITLLDDPGNEVLPGVRTDSMGNFTINAARATSWRVKAVRIGYTAVISDPLDLAVGAVAVVRLRMTTVAQQLIPVQIVEHRQMTASELMSIAGFDLREQRGEGKFLSGERLAVMKKDGVREILGSQFQPNLFVKNDSILGDVLRLRQGASDCAPEIFLDGRLLATAPGPGAIIGDTPPVTPMDSLRLQGRFAFEQQRLGFGQMNALNILSTLTAEMLHGIEVYRANEVPPASLGAWFGMTKASVKACGAVAIWTKAGAISLTAARNAEMPGRPVQIITGTLVDFDTGMPVVGRSITLLSETRQRLGSAAVSDEYGDFTLRTVRTGDVRLAAGGEDYVTSTTPTFRISTNELVVVRLSVAAHGGVLAPLGVAGRLVPQNVGVSSVSGFTFRRERAQGGSYFRVRDLEKLGARSVIDVVRNVEGVFIEPGPSGDGVAIVRPDAPRCAPSFYLDGTLLGSGALTTIAALPLSRVFGIEVYTKPAEIPALFIDAGSCGLIVVWTR